MIRVVIIGGGFSGTLTALNLLRRVDRPPLSIVLCDRSGTFGPGPAYSAPTENFLLNVRARLMGAWPEEPEDFWRWLLKEGYPTSAEDFVPRAWYGKYLKELLSTVSRRRDDILTLVADAAMDIIPSTPLCVCFAGGRPIDADVVVLALGGLPRSTLGDISNLSHFSHPYDLSSYEKLPSDGRVLLVGTGLTAVDFVVESEARGFCGHYTLISRHGRLPLAHEPPAGEHPVAWQELSNLRNLCSVLGHRAKALGSSQPFVESIRPHLQYLWQHLTDRERRTFLRHLRPIWESHRHRIPPPHGQLIKSLKENGRLRTIAGNLQNVERHHGRLAVTYTLRRGCEAQTPPFDRIVLCAGPETDIRRCEMPLIRNLLRREFLLPGPLGLGAQITPSLRDRLRPVGVLQKEDLWEISAVRELRAEAASLAREICGIGNR